MRPIGRLAPFLTALLALLIGLGGFAAAGFAQVSVSPSVVVFDGDNQTKAITATNAGPREQLYRISLVNLRMLPDGRMVPADPPLPGEHFANALVRFSPREVAIAPGASEVIRLHVGATPPGEYRTHVLVQEVPETGPLETPPFLRGDGVSVDLQAVFGVAVPLLIRRGELPVAVSFASARLDDLQGKTPAIAIRIARSGERSVRGALTLRENGKQIAFFDGVAIYAPMPYRDLVLPLAQLDLANLRPGSLDVEFSEDAEIKGAVAAKTLVALP